MRRSRSKVTQSSMLDINTVHHGDCLDALRDMNADSVDLVCTDPPYGYAFMGKDWDKSTPPQAIWNELYRVLKPGCFAFIMCSPRLDCLTEMGMKLRGAGFKCDFSMIHWAVASGFPKAMNISKAMDKRLGIGKKEMVPTKKGNLPEQAGEISLGATGMTDISKPISPQAKSLDGSYAGFQPKPAVEQILVVMKPLSEKSYVDQALKDGKGVTWLDEAKIPCKSKESGSGNASLFVHNKHNDYTFDTSSGRFPANLVCEDDVLNTGENHSSCKSTKHHDKYNEDSILFDGISHPGNQYNDSGSFSRFFDLDAWFDKRIQELSPSVQRTFPFLITPKPSKAEKNKGCDNTEGTVRFSSNQGSGKMMPSGKDESHKIKGNHHPTCKPIKLMSWLITIGSREGDIVLDPFAGSGTTLIAAELLRRKYIGIERESEYIPIIEARLKEASRQMRIF